MDRFDELLAEEDAEDRVGPLISGRMSGQSRRRTSASFSRNVRRVSARESMRQSIRNSRVSLRDMFGDSHDEMEEIFEKHDTNKDGILNQSELRDALTELAGEEVTWEETAIILDEFDKDGNCAIDISEFMIMASFLDDEEEEDFASKLHNVVKMSKKTERNLLREVSARIYPFRDSLCIQGEVEEPNIVSTDHDIDFQSAFAPSQMRCLALVSHNEMKKTMKDFVLSNRNILKKFRLTGTNSTMTMLKEVFKDETGIVFGPSCQSGPLGGDAELVGLMCSGRLGGMIFFQDPMNAHPHQCDIACLLRQALVHNTLCATTPCTALMIMHTLRCALKEQGKPELIPSFFFSLQSPAVAAYKAAQKKVIASHADNA